MCHNYKLFSVNWEQLYKVFFILSPLSFICPVKKCWQGSWFYWWISRKTVSRRLFILIFTFINFKHFREYIKIAWINKKADTNAGWVHSWKASKWKSMTLTFCCLCFCYLIGEAVIISFNWYYLAPVFPDFKSVVGTSFVLSCWDSLAIYPAMQTCELPLLNSVFDTTNYNFLWSFWRILSFVSVRSHDSW